MLNPSVNDLMKNIPGRYLLVNMCAARARRIAESAEENEEILDEKPVKLAVNEISRGLLAGHMKISHTL